MSAPLAVTVFDTLVFLAVVVPFVLLVRHRNAIPRLPSARAGIVLPSVSVVVPARDEAASISRALGSLLAQDYPDLEVIAVDDRSADGTGALLHEVAAREPRLVVLRVDDLPAGWLGKNHALWRGAEQARGEWLLFTDADVVFAPDALRRAVGYALEQGLDHLTLAPRLIAHGIFLRACGAKKDPMRDEAWRERQMVESLLQRVSHRATERVRCEDHVRVGEEQPLAPRLLRPAPERMVLPEPSRGQIVDAEHDETRLARCDFVQQGAGAIGGAIVHRDHLQIRIVLGEQ